MATGTLLTPTLHVEVLLADKVEPHIPSIVRAQVKESLANHYAFLQVGVDASGHENTEYASLIHRVSIADYTGPDDSTDHHELKKVRLDVVTYSFKSNEEIRPRRRISQQENLDDAQQARILQLPNVALKNEWDSLIYDNALPSQLLRYLARMLGVMKQPGLNLSTFNWNRLCLLHGPPGSGKSTLCRALAQKLSIRLSPTYPHAVLVEINTNYMLSKYFGESGKLIGALFEKIHSIAQSSTTLVCVVMDEVETIAGSREKATSGGECTDSIRATNQLLTALDRLRVLPNIIVLCTSNLLAAIDPAFLDRVDIKQLIPSPSVEAIYNIFRSCLIELVRASLIDTATATISVPASSSSRISSPPSSSSVQRLNQKRQLSASISPTWTMLEVPTIPTLEQMMVEYYDQPEASCRRLWDLARKCVGFSGRTLRRLPILGLAMFTWGGNCSVDSAITALDNAVDQELKAKQDGK